MDINKLFNIFEKSYYTLILLFLIEILALVFALQYVRKQKIGRYFIYYILFDFTVLIVDWGVSICKNVDVEFKSKFIAVANTSIAMVELLVYYSFFQIVLLGKSIRQKLRILKIIYTCLILLYFITEFKFVTNRFGYISYILGVIEFLFLIPPCIIYFQQILKTDSKLKLLERPSFWIVTGIFFYSLISVPYYLLKKYLDSSQLELTYIIAAAFFYIPFIINFIFLIKAFSCKKTLTT